MLFEVLAMLDDDAWRTGSPPVQINGHEYWIDDVYFDESLSASPVQIILEDEDGRQIDIERGSAILADMFVPTFSDAAGHPCDVLLWPDGTWCYEFERFIWSSRLSGDTETLSLGTLEHHDVITCDDSRFRHAAARAK